MFFSFAAYDVGVSLLAFVDACVCFCVRLWLVVFFFGLSVFFFV